MFSSIFDIDDAHLQFVRGKEKLKTFSTTKSIGSGKLMTNHFCEDCGSLMYRVSERYPGHSLLRLGTVDDFNLVEGRLRPTMEIYVKDRCCWVKGLEDDGAAKFDGSPR
jgi:hypothetical protein